VQAPLSLPDDAGREIELSGLERFLQNPARHFLRERLGVRLEEGEGALEDAETFQLDRLAAYRLRDEALGAVLAEADGERAVLALAAARGELPLGPAGALTFARETAEVPALAERLRPAVAGALPALEVDLTLDGFRLRGWLHGVTPGGLVTYRATKPKARDLLRLWVRHLALCALAPPGVALASRHYGVNGTFALGPGADPRSTLQALARAYRDGLAAPLPFFPETALAWVRAARTGKDWDRCWQAARPRWHDEFRGLGEALDPYVAVAFRDWEPPDAAFAAAAEAVLGPLLEAEGEEGGDAPA
jgi:exodeoxyribonuclease V gamma subunit